MNQQQIFNKVSKHLLKQMHKSLGKYSQDGSICCAYRGDNNMKCAIGCLITNKDYNKSMENVAVSKLLEDTEFNFLLSIKKLNGIGESFLNDLQTIHDNNRACYWKEELLIFAERYGLNTLNMV